MMHIIDRLITKFLKYRKVRFPKVGETWVTTEHDPFSRRTIYIEEVLEDFVRYRDMGTNARSSLLSARVAVYCRFVSYVGKDGEGENNEACD